MNQTMKITALAILALTGATEASNMSGQEIQDRMNKMDKHSLLRKARVLENSGFQIDGSFNIKFDSCTSLSVLTDEVMESVGNGYGAFVASKDFVVFTASNNYGSTKFAMDISTFATSMASTILTENENYCEVCADAQQSCSYGASSTTNYSGQQQNNGSNNGYQMSNGGNRDLGDGTGDIEAIDCNTCNSVCSEKTYQGYTYQSTYYTEQAAEWLQEVAACQLLDSDDGYNLYNLYNDNASSKYGSNSANSANSANSSNNGYNGNQYEYQQQLYAGMMCNAAGTGMEIGVFMDEECTVWNSEKSFSSTLTEGSGPYKYYSKTKNLIQYIFTQPVSCKATQYFSPYNTDDQQNYQNQNDDYNYNQYQVPEANEGCQSLFGGTQVSVSDSCYSGDDNESQGSYSGEYTYYSSHGWQTYTYDIMDTEDQFQICTSIQAQLSGGSTHTTNTQAKKKNLYNYKNNQKMEGVFHGSSMGAMSGQDIFVIVISVFLAIIGLYVFAKVCWSRRGNQDKKEALLSSREIS
jgi:hypothetical protein